MKEARKDKYLKYVKLNLALVFILQILAALYYTFILQIYHVFLPAVAGVTMGVCIQVYVCFLRKDKLEDKQ